MATRRVTPGIQMQQPVPEYDPNHPEGGIGEDYPDKGGGYTPLIPTGNPLPGVDWRPPDIGGMGTGDSNPLPGFTGGSLGPGNGGGPDDWGVGDNPIFTPKPLEPNFSDVPPNMEGGMGVDGINGDVRSILSSILKGGVGNPNEAALTSRLDSARGSLAQRRKGDLAQTQATLASRGLIGSGPETDALRLEDEDIAQSYGNQFGDIFADETTKADQRFQNALSLATGLSQSDIQSAIDNYRATNDFNLGQGQLSLQEELGQYGLQNESVSQLIALIQQLMNGAAIGKDS